MRDRQRGDGVTGVLLVTGVHYSYTRRELFESTFNAITAAPRANEQTVLTSFRYYSFQ